MDPLLLIALALACVALGAVAGVLLTRTTARAHSEAELARARAGHAESQAELGRRAGAAEALVRRLEEENAELVERSRTDGAVLRALEPVQAALTRMDAHVGELERGRAAQFSSLAAQLDEARRSDAALREATETLHRALRSTSARGSWGELELRRVLELSGLTRHVSFDEQRSHTAEATGADGGRAGRPDVTVHLPGEREVLIDAKVPMDAYLELASLSPAAPARDAPDVPSSEAAELTERRRAQLLHAHAAAVRGHVDALAGRDYPRHVAGAVDLVVLFVPSEGLLSQALDTDPTLLDHALRKGVALTTPTSLLALLRSVAAVWTQEKVAEEAQEILDLGRELTARLGTVAGHLDKLGGSLRSSVQHYNRTVGSLEDRLLVTARRFESLDPAGVPEPGAIASEKGQVRAFTSLVPTSEHDGTAPPELPWDAAAERRAALGTEPGERTPGERVPVDLAPGEDPDADTPRRLA